MIVGTAQGWVVVSNYRPILLCTRPVFCQQDKRFPPRALRRGCLLEVV